MKKFLLALLILTSGSMAVGQEVTKLPQDGQKWYLTVFGTAGEARFEAVKTWFQNDKSLIALKEQTHYNAYRADSTMFAERYSQSTKDLPCIRLQDSEGKVIYQASSSNIPGTPEALYDSMSRTIQGTENCPWKKTPPKEPDPEPAKPDDKAGPPDTVKPVPSGGESGLPVWVLVVLAIVGVTVGVRRKIKETYYPEG